MHGAFEGSQLVTRYAPSPTGWLHLGHVANALWTWGTARKLSARVILRIEDHDRTRCRREYEQQVLADLEWLGFAPEAETTSSLRAGPSPYRQSDSCGVYDAALNRLAEQGLVYGCKCSRSTIARELGDGFTEGQELTYPGLCRDKGIEPGTRCQPADPPAGHSRELQRSVPGRTAAATPIPVR